MIEEETALQIYTSLGLCWINAISLILGSSHVIRVVYYGFINFYLIIKVHDLIESLVYVCAATFKRYKLIFMIIVPTNEMSLLRGQIEWISRQLG
jgi:hypothetical protein